MRHQTHRHQAGIALGMAAALALSGCSFTTASVADAQRAYQQALSADVSTPAIIEAGTLTVGVVQGPSSAPLSVIDEGSYEGINAETASIVADELGLDVKFVTVDDPEKSLGSTCDVVMGVGADSYDGVDAVGSYAESAYAFFGTDAPDGQLTADDFAGKTVGVQSGSVAAAKLEASGLDVTERDFSDLSSAFDALEDGSADYVLCGAYSGAYLAHERGSISFCGTIDAPSAIGIGVKSTNTELKQKVQQALDQAGSSGVLDLMRPRWVGDMGHLTTDDEVQGVKDVSHVTGSSRSSSGPSSSARGTSGSARSGSSSGSSSATGGDAGSATSSDGTSFANAGDGSTAGANAVSTARSY